MSAPPPGAKSTMMRTGFVGYSCAQAMCDTARVFRLTFPPACSPSPRRGDGEQAGGKVRRNTLAVSHIAWAQEYPTKPVRIIVDFAPGGGADIAARLIGQWLSERLGQSFVIENRPGAGSNIATEAVVNAAPDGYSLLLASSANAINATLYDKLNFNFIRDIAPVASLTREPNVMVVNPSVPARTVPEFIAYAKAN